MDHQIECDGQCKHKSLKCNLIYNCRDGRDENSCEEEDYEDFCDDLTSCRIKTFESKHIFAKPRYAQILSKIFQVFIK